METIEEDAAHPDTSGQPDIPGHWVSVRKASHLLAQAAMPRNKRTIRRYCERGELECQKTENALHQPQYFINPASITEYIEQQKTLSGFSPDTSGHTQTEPDTSGQDLIDISSAFRTEDQPDTSGRDRTRPDDKDMIEFLKGQVIEKDKQIGALLERDHETNFLIKGLQEMMFALKPGHTEPTEPKEPQGDNPHLTDESSAVEYNDGGETNR
jgi:hypothetical protein